MAAVAGKKAQDVSTNATRIETTDLIDLADQSFPRVLLDSRKALHYRVCSRGGEMRFSTILRRVNIALLFLFGSWQLAAAVPPTAGASDDIQRKVESTTKFIYERSGLEVSRELKRRLAAMEQRSLVGPGGRIIARELIDIITDTAVDRLSRLSDQEIQLALDTYRHDADAKYDYVQITDDGRYTATSSEFVRTLKSFSERSRRGDQALRNTVREFVQGKGAGEGVNGRLEVYSKSLTEFAGAEGGLTALQSLLVVYSLASDDMLNVPTSRLREYMAHVHETIGGDRYPSPRERFPFGAKGYLFPTPVNIILDERTLGELLDRMDKKMNER